MLAGEVEAAGPSGYSGTLNGTTNGTPIKKSDGIAMNEPAPVFLRVSDISHKQLGHLVLPPYHPKIPPCPRQPRQGV